MDWKMISIESDPLLLILRRILYACLLLMILSACGSEYTALPIHGKVVNADSGEPIEGVHILVWWPTYGGFEGGNHDGNIAVREAVTGKDGNYRIAGWGPMRGSGLHEDEPTMIVFKPWYRFQWRYKNRNPRLLPTYETKYTDASKPLDFFWNGKTLKLKAVTEAEKHEYLKNDLSLLSTFIHFLYSGAEGNDCDWEDAPRFLEMIDRHYRELTANYYKEFSPGSLRPISAIGVLKGCSALSEVFANR